ncbi:MAG: SufD family Fe-S cluster assembly protein [Bacilli bacterium]|nr:SufD family Fe-S cluster assembly protein [Bacilli bacterium]
MKKIVIDNNRLDDYRDSNIIIRDNKIIFNSNGDYTLEYVNSGDINLDIDIADNVTIKLFIWSNGNDLKILNHYKLGYKSNLMLFKFYYNNNVDENVVIDLNGEYSHLSYNFSSISRGKEEYHIIVNHNHHRVSSNISNKCIGLDNSKIKLQIDSVLDKGNTLCVMDQNSRILTLGKVEATIIPNMFIEEDSVEAKHGSIVGRIAPEEIFYLMSRGITEEEAVTLLIKGFIFSNLVVDMEKRARIFQVIQDLRR